MRHTIDDPIFCRQHDRFTEIYHYGSIEVIVISRPLRDSYGAVVFRGPRYHVRRTDHFSVDHRRWIASDLNGATVL